MLSTVLYRTVLYCTVCSAQVARMREEARRWRELQEAKVSLEEEVALWKSRFRTEAARNEELAADVAKLSSALSGAEGSVAALKQQQAQAQSLMVGGTPPGGGRGGCGGKRSMCALCAS